MKREFELKDESSNKFWSVEVAGTTQTVRYGRIGTNGQTKTKEFASHDEATAATDKLIAQKVKKGYVEVGAAATASGVREVLKPGYRSAPKKVKKVLYATGILAELGDRKYAKRHGGSVDTSESCKLQLPPGRDAVGAEHEALVQRIEEGWTELTARISESLWEFYRDVRLEEMEILADPYLLPPARSAEELASHFTCDTLILGADGESFAITGICDWDEEHGLAVTVTLSDDPAIEVGDLDLVQQGSDNFGAGYEDLDDFEDENEERPSVDELLAKHRKQAGAEPTVTMDDFVGRWKGKSHDVEYLPADRYTRYTITADSVSQQSILIWRDGRVPPEPKERDEMIREHVRANDLGSPSFFLENERDDGLQKNRLEFRGFVANRAYVLFHLDQEPDVYIFRLNEDGSFDWCTEEDGELVTEWNPHGLRPEDD